MKDNKLELITEKIENLKIILNGMARNCDNLYNKEIIKISEKMDALIIEYLKLKQNTN